MLVIKAKVNKANGRLLGASVFLTAVLLEELGVQGDILNLNARVENGEIIIKPQ